MTSKFKRAVSAVAALAMAAALLASCGGSSSSGAGSAAASGSTAGLGGGTTPLGGTNPRPVFNEDRVSETGRQETTRTGDEAFGDGSLDDIINLLNNRRK